MIELSTAIKCPNINTFLCTFKVFQYYLQKPEVLKKFLPDDLIANDISRFFSKIYYVDQMSEEERQNIFKEIRSDVTKYIVKPQKEGGGNNYYNEEILKLFPSETGEGSESESKSINETLQHAMIMERINPPDNETLILHENKLKTVSCISEVSVYGIVLSDEKTVHINKSVGFLLRTKDKMVQEGGVIVGISAIDMPYLMDIKLDKNSQQPLSYEN
jgi:glutathione synthase